MDGIRNKTSRIRGVSQELQLAARELRSDPTDAEKLLWSIIQDKKLDGIRFRKRHPIGTLVLDFYAPRYRLAVEADGGIHDGQKDRDEARDALLNAYKIKVVRVPNTEIFANVNLVRRRIIQAAAEQASLLLNETK